MNSPMEVEVDALELKKLIEKSEETEDIRTKMELLTKACRIYKGEFLRNFRERTGHCLKV